MKLSSLFQQEDRQLIEKYCQDRARSSYMGKETALCRVLGQILMYVDTNDLSLTPHMLMNGFWEMWVTQAVANYVKPGMRCIDVGANCGYYTLLLAELVGEKGFVQGYEPQSVLSDLVEMSITVNGYRQAQISRDAVSDQARPAVMLHLHPALSGSASLRGLGVPDESHAHVDCVTLDYDGFDEARSPPVDFVKIDVQGHEMEVLRGMQGTILRCPKIAIAMEFTPGDHEDPVAALQEIERMGLTIRTIGTDGMIRHIQLAEAVKADTGDHRMLWLSRPIG